MEPNPPTASSRKQIVIDCSHLFHQIKSVCKHKAQKGIHLLLFIRKTEEEYLISVEGNCAYMKEDQIVCFHFGQLDYPLLYELNYDNI